MLYSGNTVELLEEVSRYLDSEQGKVETYPNKQLNNLAQLCNYLLYNDREMDMPNMSAYIQKINRLIKEESIARFSTGRFNIKDVSGINKKYGFETGTRIIKKYIDRLLTVMGESGCVYRVGGDNFLILYERENHEEVRRFLSYVEIDTDIEEVPKIEMRSRTGYVLNLGDVHSWNQVMDQVNQAGQLAKNNNYSSFMIYDNEVKEKIEGAKEVSKLFPSALEKEEFLVYYQPKINIKNDSLHGAEALCRWLHEDEMISPGSFIPVLEQSYAICKLDFYMLEHVCRDIRNWLDEGLNVKPISINFSRLNLTEKNLAQHIIRIIDKYQIPRNLVEIELTETTTDGDIQAIRQLVIELGSCGVGTAIDDFGVGYSSLNLLRDMPWKVLKLDKCFLPSVDDNKLEEKTIVLKSMISMAIALGMECLSEGAENIEQVRIVERCGCEVVQGDYYYKPMSRANYEGLMKKQNEE